MMTANKMNLTPTEERQLLEMTSHGLTKKTWSNYKTAEKMLAKCCKELGMKKELPVDESTVLKFVLWLANTRKLKATTINNYLAGIRQLHIMKGADPPKLRSNIIQLALKGKKNLEARQDKQTNQPTRKPITPDILLLIKARLSESLLKTVDKRLIWTVCTNAFFGAFRGAELLCQSEATFDPDYTLMAEDIVMIGNPEEVIQYRIKAPKEDKLGKTVIVDVYKSRDDICPVRAFKKWQDCNPPQHKGQPAFRWDDGTPLTSRKLNEILKERLTGYIDNPDKYTTHSFRTGAASMMGTLGYSDKDIQLMGKWNSRAFESYIRLPRTKRKAVAKDFSGQFD